METIDPNTKTTRVAAFIVVLLKGDAGDSASGIWGAKGALE
jgi:hypothetical protein